MATIYLNYCITTVSKRFAYLQNKFFRHFIPFRLKSSLKRTNILIGSCIYLIFSNAPYSIIKGVKAWA